MKKRTAELILQSPEKFAHHGRVFLNNPVVMQGMGLAPLVVVATTGQNGLMLAAAVALLLNDKRMGIPAMVIAVLVTFSRLYLYVHYPTDVIFSIIVGTAFAFIGNALAGKIADRLPAPAKGKYES